MTSALTLGTPAQPGPLPVDGTWVAFADGLGGTLKLVLADSKGQVTGTGAYSVGALRSGSLAVAGHYKPPLATLSLRYDHGLLVVLRATVGENHMRGRLTYDSGSVVDLEFVRP